MSCAGSIRGGVRGGSRHELGGNGGPGPVPSRMTVYRILVRHGLIDPANAAGGRGRTTGAGSGTRPMQLWQMDIVGGILLAGRRTEAKVVTGVDDHSRFCVIATVVARATGRAVCLAFAEALAPVRGARRRC